MRRPNQFRSWRPVAAMSLLSVHVSESFMDQQTIARVGGFAATMGLLEACGAKT